MSALFGGGVTTPNYTGLQIQTATNALPVPIIIGANKASPNLIWYNNFRMVKSSGILGSKGGLFGNPGGSDYAADLIMAIGEGPINGIGIIWRGQSTYTAAGLNLTLFNGTTPQATWSYLTTAYPSQSLAYQGTAYVAESGYDLGASASLENHNFEVFGILYATGFNAVDADPAQAIDGFLTNQQWGVQFPAANIDYTTLYGASGDSSYQTYCLAVGLALSPCLTNTETAETTLTRWLQLTNTGAVWSGTKLKFIPYGDEPIVAGTIIQVSEIKEIFVPPPPSSGPTPPPTLTVSFAPTFHADLGVVYTNSGAALAYIGTGSPGSAGEYGISPSGTYIFNPEDNNTQVTITYTYAVPTSYTPNLVPIYILDDDDFLVKDDNTTDDPVQVSRTDPYEAYNVWRLEIAERDNAYNLVPVESRDQDAIQLYGLRVASTVTAHEICDNNVAAIAGQLILQRALYVRATFKFTLPWDFCLLDPMDIVSITDAALAIDAFPVRVVGIEEGDDGFLQMTCEELSQGVGTAALYQIGGASNAPINGNVAADPVNAPIIFEPPAALVGAAPQVWAVVSGGSGAVADSNWGGANVYVSLDNIAYTQIGTITAPARQGVTTATLAAYGGSNPDNTNTLPVNMAESAGVLNTATMTDAANAVTLCIVGGTELVSYATATLTGANAYGLTGLYRGLYGSQPISHASGVSFARLDAAVFKYNLPPQYIGQTIYLKFQSFSILGGGVQDISTCVAYAYVPPGSSSALGPIATLLAAGIPMDWGLISQPVNLSDTFGLLGDPFTIRIDLGGTLP